MHSKPGQSTISNDLRLKAILTTSKTHYIQKVIQFRLTAHDAFKDQFTSSMGVFIPKLKLDYPKPCVMAYFKNGNGRCLIRVKNPLEMADKLEHLAMILRSNLWADIWLHLEEISQDINGNDFCNDKKFIDCDPVNDSNCY